MFVFFYKSDPYDLTLWPSELKIKIGHVPTNTNRHVKYETSVVNSSQDNEQKHVYIVLTKVTFATLTFDLANPNQ